MKNYEKIIAAYEADEENAEMREWFTTMINRQNDDSVSREFSKMIKDNELWFLNYIAQMGRDINVPFALSKAVEAGDPDKVEFLLDHGFTENLDYALSQAEEADQTEIVCLLINGQKKDPKPEGTEVWEVLNDPDMTFEKLKENNSHGYEDLLRASVRLHCFDRVVDLSIKSVQDSLSAKDFLTLCEDGVPIIERLAKRSQLDQVFRPGLWLGRETEMIELWNKIETPTKEKFNFGLALGATRRLSLRRKMHGAKRTMAPK